MCPVPGLPDKYRVRTGRRGPIVTAVSRLEGVRAVITGAASGIGEATTRLFVQEGALVVMADVEAERGARIAAELGSQCRFLPTDVSQEGAVDAAVALAVADFGGLDCMFNNAGTGGSTGSLDETDMATFDRTVAIHLRGVFLGIRAAARVMRPQGRGSIINTSSVAGLSGGFAGHDYSACKAAIIQLTKTTANELGEDGVRVNAICPGAIATAIYGRMVGLDADAAQRAVGFMTDVFRNAAPIQRSGQALDIAEAALWLASDSSAYVNGQAIAVDGGLLTGPLRRNRPGPRDAQARAAFRDMILKAAEEPGEG
jgi:NAD(P)-dependent dehydrogenase (short-subunit alcohol dehydrogenase family)